MFKEFIEFSRLFPQAGMRLSILALAHCTKIFPQVMHRLFSAGVQTGSRAGAARRTLWAAE